jgi:hypothetical protein
VPDRNGFNCHGLQLPVGFAVIAESGWGVMKVFGGWWVVVGEDEEDRGILRASWLDIRRST